MADHSIFKLGTLKLQRGHHASRARFWPTRPMARLNADKSNVILYPTSYGAQHTDTEWLIGPGRVLDPAEMVHRHSRICSATGCRLRHRTWPSLSAWAATPCSRTGTTFTHRSRMLAEVFGIETLALAYGWSMGGQQALHWGAIFPDQVERICAVCTSARTSIHNKVFIDSVRATLTADPAWHRGTFRRAAGARSASDGPCLRRMGDEPGLLPPEALRNQWDSLRSRITSCGLGRRNFLRRNGEDLLSMLATWTQSDISDNHDLQGRSGQGIGRE